MVMDGRIKELLKNGKKGRRVNITHFLEHYKEFSEGQDLIRRGQRKLTEARIGMDEVMLRMLEMKRSDDD